MGGSSKSRKSASDAAGAATKSTSGAAWGSSDRGCGPPPMSNASVATEIHVLVGIIEDADGRVLVNQRRPGTHMAGFWEFPGGKRDEGETARGALCRELAEELGIDVLEAAPMLELVHQYPEKRVRLDVWRVERYAGEPRGLERQALRWVAAESLTEIGLLPADTPIVDALLLARAHSNQRE
jgi:mutator protein MutT